MNAELHTTPWGVALGASVQGASHIADGTCCQDAASIKEGFFRGLPYMACTVADGHGDKKYTHSDLGANLAVLAAENTAMQLMQILVLKRRMGKRAVEQYVATHLKETWIDLIRQSAGSFRVAAELIEKHGTTVLSVLFFGERAYMAQLGDGAVCTVSGCGKPAFLVEPESGPISNLADSLCCPDAGRRWAFGSAPVDGIKTLMMSTDGLVNSLASNEGYVELANTLDSHMRNVPAHQIKQALPSWLGDYSEQGSGDDISVIAVAMNETTTTKEI